MGRLFITGDTHGDVDVNKLGKKWFKKYVKEAPYFHEDDYVVILGDFGFPFFDIDYMKTHDKYNEYGYWCKWLSALPCTILFIDGNHDNHSFWDAQPVTKAFGGNVHIHPHIKKCYHLMRGEVYDILGYRCFAFGGAASTDKDIRVIDITWWEREVASEKEFENAKENLKCIDNTVDLVFTHTMPMSLIRVNNYKPIEDNTANFLDIFYNNAKGKDAFGGIDFDKWYCGHFHVDKVMGIKVKCLYNDYDILPER